MFHKVVLPVALVYDNNTLLFKGIKAVEYQYSEVMLDSNGVATYRNLSVNSLPRLIPAKNLLPNEDLLGSNTYGVVVKRGLVSCITAASISLVTQSGVLLQDKIYQIIATSTGNTPVKSSKGFLVAPDGTFTEINCSDLDDIIKSGVKIGNLDAAYFGCAAPIGLVHKSAIWMPAAVDLNMALPSECFTKIASRFGEIPVLSGIPDSSVVAFPTNCIPIEIKATKPMSLSLLSLPDIIAMPCGIRLDNAVIGGLKLSSLVKMPTSITVGTVTEIVFPEKVNDFFAIKLCGSYLGSSLTFDSKITRNKPGSFRYACAQAPNLSTVNVKYAGGFFHLQTPVASKATLNVNYEKASPKDIMNISLKAQSGTRLTVNLNENVKTFNLTLEAWNEYKCHVYLDVYASNLDNLLMIIPKQMTITPVLRHSETGELLNAGILSVINTTN